jgi:pimeloyl-ACP methyl ester carboxylesterase
MRTFELNDKQGKIRYHDLPGKGTPIIFLHGMGCASSSDFPQVASNRVLRGRRMLLIDLPGSGFSDCPQDFGYTVEDHAHVIIGLIDGLNFKKVNLFGHSMGGSIAISIASLCKSRVERLVLGEPNLDPGGGIFSRPIAMQNESDYITHGHTELIKDAYRQGNDIWAKSLSLSLPAAIHREAVSLVNGSKPSWREQLAALKVPRTVLFGENSLPDPDTKRLLEIGVKVRIIPKSGHSMMWENPAGLAKAIRNSL